MSDPNPSPSSWRHSAFYRFVPIASPVQAAEQLRPMAQGLLGSVVLAHEGISGALAGAANRLAALEQALQQPTFVNGALAGMVFKHSACTTVPFGRLKVSVKPELVALGLPESVVEASDAIQPSAIDDRDASHLSPAAWRRLLLRGDAVLLDNRNHFEYRLGHFRGAQDPQVHHFRDFVAYVQDQAPAWRAAQRPLAMYCTGGIRCDKTAPWLRSLGLQVWQLDGGVLNYLAQMQGAEPPDDSIWQGECFVFDNRIALDGQLQESATTAAQVYDAAHPDEAWRLQRAQRLDETDPT